MPSEEFCKLIGQKVEQTKMVKFIVFITTLLLQMSNSVQNVKIIDWRPCLKRNPAVWLDERIFDLIISQAQEFSQTEFATERMFYFIMLSISDPLLYKIMIIFWVFLNTRRTRYFVILDTFVPIWQIFDTTQSAVSFQSRQTNS